MARRRYTDADRAAALAALDANGGNIRKTSRDTGISPSTLIGWRDSGLLDGTEVRTEKKASLAERLREIAYTLVNAIPDKVSDANLQQVSTSLGIAIDKLQLLEGRPTNIDEVRDDLSDDERAARVEALLERARARRAGLAPPN